MKSIPTIPVYYRIADIHILLRPLEIVKDLYYLQTRTLTTIHPANWTAMKSNYFEMRKTFSEEHPVDTEMSTENVKCRTIS